MVKLALIFLIGCTTAEARMTEATTFTTDEDRYFATQAALLDPRAYHLSGTVFGDLDVTVPDRHTWFATNTFAVYYNEPQDVAQDSTPGTRRSGFLRPLDARRAFALSAGTRVRNIGRGTSYQINTAYIYYADPQDVWDIDARYTADPKGLYYSRLARLATLPISEAIIEVNGGGAINDDVHLDLPAFGSAMLVNVSVYDASWMTIGWIDNLGIPLNVMNEVNNSHSVRFAESVMQPIRFGPGLRVTLNKGSNADMPGSTDPAIAYPIKGSGSLVYQVLPSDW